VFYFHYLNLSSPDSRAIPSHPSRRFRALDPWPLKGILHKALRSRNNKRTALGMNSRIAYRWTRFVLALAETIQEKRTLESNESISYTAVVSRSASYRRIKQPSSQRMELARRRKIATTTSFIPNRRHSASRLFCLKELGGRRLHVHWWIGACIHSMMVQLMSRANRNTANLTQPSAQRVETREVIRTS
jgi:hypothetical protein